MGVEDWIKNVKKAFKLLSLRRLGRIPTTTERKHANDLKVHEQTVRTAIKEDSSPELNPFDCAICDALENQMRNTIQI